MSLLKRLGIVVLIIAVLVLMVWFTSLNPGLISIDLAFGIVEPTIPLALSVAFVLGMDRRPDLYRLCTYSNCSMSAGGCAAVFARVNPR